CRFGRIDVLVNNAASFYTCYFEELTPEQIESLARPAGLEPATPGLEVPRREATRGSTTLLPLISLTFGQAPDHPTPPRAAPHCQSFVSRLSPLDNERYFLTDPSQVHSISR